AGAVADTLLAEPPRSVDRRSEVETLVLRLLDQHHRLERVHVVDPLLLALRRNLRLVRPVVELHLRDSRNPADLAQVQLDLVEMFREIDWLQQLDLPRVGHASTPSGLYHPGLRLIPASFQKGKAFWQNLS